MTLPTLFTRVCDLHLASGKELFAHRPRVETYQCGEFTIRFNGTGERREGLAPYSGGAMHKGYIFCVVFDRHRAMAIDGSEPDVLAALDKAIEEATHGR